MYLYLIINFMKGYWFNKQRSLTPDFQQEKIGFKQRNKGITRQRKQKQSALKNKSTKSLHKSQKQVSHKSLTENKSVQNQKKVFQTNKIDQVIPHNANVLKKFEQFIQKMSKISKRFAAMHQFYTVLIEAEQFGHIATRCFYHNNQIILYCHDDHTSLCAQCMYGDKSKKNASQKISPSPKTIDNLSRYNEQSKFRSRNHTNHKVTQIVNSMPQVEEDLRKLSIVLKQDLNKISYSLKQWRKLLLYCEQSKHKEIEKLETWYNKESRQLSQKYLKSKNKINQLHNTYGSKIEKVVESLTYIKNIANPMRFVLPVIQHVWYQEAEEMISSKVDNSWKKGTKPIDIETDLVHDLRNYLKYKGDHILTFK